VRFPSPLSKPDVPISSIRVSDGFHDSDSRRRACTNLLEAEHLKLLSHTVNQLRQYHQLPRASDHQCRQRVAERQDPVGEIHGKGFRNKQNFIHAIYFDCGGLDLAPSSTK
jgi:hypothetical protein